VWVISSRRLGSSLAPLVCSVGRRGGALFGDADMSVAIYGLLRPRLFDSVAHEAVAADFNLNPFPWLISLSHFKRYTPTGSPGGLTRRRRKQ
jgi:hypothetical protein